MLSIRFDDEREWWVSGAVFKKLFRGCLEAGTMPARLSHWGDIADANGGLSLDRMKAKDAQDFTGALLTTALTELSNIVTENSSLSDKIYASRLYALIDLMRMRLQPEP